MSMFIDTSRIAVTADGEVDVHAVTPDMDVMYIRRKMDFGTRQKVTSAAMRMVGNGKQSSASLDIGAWQLALAQHNILDWAGPSFAGVACTPANIARLDPNQPLLIAAMRAIGERNQDGGLFLTDPKASAAPGATNGAGAA